jgi:beta-N-acetylhexosaminidase
MVRDLSLGGVIVYGAQMSSFQQAKDDITNMQRHAWMPLFVAADEEGGFVERIQNVFGHRPGALEMYQTGQVSNAAKLGHSIAHDLKSLGINTDLAPDIDVPLVNGPDQYMRTWGYTPDSVITYGGAYLRAIQGDGEVGCIKHFPGLGAARTDAHAELPVVKRSRDEIFSTELAPFAHFIHSSNKLERPGMIMSTDVLMPAIDPVWPAELSHTFITDILRNQLGYNGVILTDALYMKGISKKWNLPTAVVLALQAGNDMILGAVGAYQVTEAINGIKQALNDGRLSIERLNESAKRIVALKLSTHLWPSPELSMI